MGSISDSRIISTVMGTVQTGLFLSPYLYFGDPAGGKVVSDDKYTYWGPDAIKHIKLDVASLKQDDFLLSFDTLDLYCGVNTQVAPPSTLQDAAAAEHGLTGEAGYFSQECRGPSLGLPMSLQRVHFLAYSEDGCNKPKEHFAYFLVSKPVQTNTNIGLLKGDISDDSQEQEKGSVLAWNKQDYILDNGMPADKPCDYTSRLIIGGSSPESIFGVDYWERSDLGDGVVKCCPSDDSQDENCVTDYLEKFEFVTQVHKESGDESVASDCVSCDDVQVRKIDLQDIADAAIHLFFEKLRKEIQADSESDDVMLIYGFDTNDNKLQYKGIRLTCSSEGSYIPQISFTRTSGTLFTTTTECP